MGLFSLMDRKWSSLHQETSGVTQFLESDLQKDTPGSLRV